MVFHPPKHRSGGAGFVRGVEPARRFLAKFLSEVESVDRDVLGCDILRAISSWDDKGCEDEIQFDVLGSHETLRLETT